jgi:hypothetical protein
MLYFASSDNTQQEMVGLTAAELLKATRAAGPAEYTVETKALKSMIRKKKKAC